MKNMRFLWSSKSLLHYVLGKGASNIVWGTAVNRITDCKQNGLSVRNVTSLTEVPNVNEGGGSDILH